MFVLATKGNILPFTNKQRTSPDNHYSRPPVDGFFHALSELVGIRDDHHNLVWRKAEDNLSHLSYFNT